jgi:hypothetical protein
MGGFFICLQAIGTALIASASAILIPFEGKAMQVFSICRQTIRTIPIALPSATLVTFRGKAFVTIFRKGAEKEAC